MRLNLDEHTVREIFDYDQTTGKLWWKARGSHLFENGKWSAETRCSVFNKKFAGTQAGNHTNSAGYPVLNIGARSYKNHRVIWLLMTGRWPENIDHIDGNKANNRWSNLREVSVRENCRNRPTRSDNKSGANGVYWSPEMKKWRVTLSGRHIGKFEDFDEAVGFRAKEERAEGYHENHGRA